MPPAILVRPEIEQHAYKLNCRFTVDAKPNVPATSSAMAKWEDYVLKEMRRAGHLFIEHKERLGWHYLGGGLDITAGPFAHLEPRGIPNRPNFPKRRRGEASVPVERIDNVDRDYYVQQMPRKNACELWDYELTGTFAKAILTEFLTEVPDAR